MAELVEARPFLFIAAMPFWAYMLHCADRSFYVGHTDDLEKRVGVHGLGLVAGYTRTRRPVKLVWSESFPTRMEAREAERQLKGWGRAKKLALIRGDWPLISQLAKGRKDGPSTSSDKPVSVLLHPHLNHLPSEPFALEVTVRRTGAYLQLRYRLTGPISRVCIPLLSETERQDDLWQHTCFEVFLRVSQRSGYHEINLAPSRAWAFYHFADYRDDMTAPEIETPEVRVEHDQYRFELTAMIQIGMGDRTLALNVSAIIEEKDGTKSYWALAHPSDGPPDFHHPDCFVLELPAADGA